MIDYQKLPKKRMAAMALIQNNKGQILIVKPHYHEGWLLPGGIIEENESPRNCCIREVREEIGVNITAEQILVIEYKKAIAEKTESIHFVFDGGTLTPDQIKLEESELTEFRFVDLFEAQKLTIAPISDRLPHALKALRENRILYLEVV